MEKNNAAKYAFFYMLSLVALIFMALSAGMIIFQIINKNIVDALNQYQGQFSSSILKFAISAILISTPIYYLTTWQIFKNLFSGNLGKDSGIRKWLTYFILFIASVVMLGWLIGTINSFLDGELTTKFILKSITAILISASIFTFYFYDIRRDSVDKKNRFIQIYFYASLAIVVAIFISSLFVVDSPTETRNKKFDNLILDSFNNIDGAINGYYQENEELPANLNELREEYSYLSEDSLRDPVSKVQFDYRVTADDAYELCATFKTSNKNENLMEFSYNKDRWSHDAGYQCLSQKVHAEGNGKDFIPAALSIPAR